jgi:hypothetical protein
MLTCTETFFETSSANLICYKFCTNNLNQAETDIFNIPVFQFDKPGLKNCQLICWSHLYTLSYDFIFTN